MQYILTAEEYNGLVPSKRLDDTYQVMEMLRRMVVSDAKCNETRRTSYCDGCPLSRVASRGNPNAKLLCDREQSYPK